jgi:hypothetical protein
MLIFHLSFHFPRWFLFVRCVSVCVLFPACCKYNIAHLTFLWGIFHYQYNPWFKFLPYLHVVYDPSGAVLVPCLMYNSVILLLSGIMPFPFSCALRSVLCLRSSELNALCLICFRFQFKQVIVFFRSFGSSAYSLYAGLYTSWME